MQFLAMLLPLLGLVCFAAYVWLVVVAFKHSAGWGVLVLLFSPITAIVFTIKFWPEPKKPFLLYVGSFSAYCAILLMFVVFLGGPMVKMAAEISEGEMSDERAVELMGKQMDRMENSGLMSASDKRALQEMRESMLEESGQVEQEDDSTTATLTAVVPRPEREVSNTIDRDLPKTQPTATKPAVSLASRDVVPVHQIGQHVGERLRVVMRDGNELVVRLVDDHGDELEFERRLSSGTMTVFVDPAEIRSVRKYRSR
jgi:hypothetical protein